MATCTEVLAEFALKQKIESLPGSVLEKTKLLILDGLGLALAAAREDFAQKTMKALRAFGQGSEATVVGFKDKLPVTSAPLLNGMLTHAFDFDDTHHLLVIHSTSVVMPAALATSEWLGLSGKDFITACAVGFEVSLRVAVVRGCMRCMDMAIILRLSVAFLAELRPRDVSSGYLSINWSTPSGSPAARVQETWSGSRTVAGRNVFSPVGRPMAQLWALFWHARVSQRPALLWRGRGVFIQLMWARIILMPGQ
jgi:hypothetical protein